jgi:peptide/nickel transport system permease protein
MWRMVRRRLLSAIPILLIVSFLVFVLVDLAPGDPAVTLAGEFPTPDRIAAIRRDLHLNDPLLVRYGRWLGGAVHGDLGTSLQTGKPVTSMIAPRFTVTLSLVAVALAFSIVVALVLGIVASLRPGHLLDRAITVLSSLGLATPPFWIGIVLVVAFAVNRSWLPAIGYKPLSAGPWQWFEHLILPGIALSLFLASELTLQLRNSLTEVLHRDFILAGEARGLSRSSIVLKHGMKNAGAAVVTVLGFRLAALLAGTVTIETVFVLPGLGVLAVNSVLGRDVPVLLGLVVLSAALVIVINLLVDISYGYFNPKVRA